MGVEPSVVERKPLSYQQRLEIEEDGIRLARSYERLEGILRIPPEHGSRYAPGHGHDARDEDDGEV